MDNIYEKTECLENRNPLKDPEGRSPQNTKLTQLAGTGFMLSPLEAMERLRRMGYDAEISLCFDHLKIKDGEEHLFPEDFDLDGILRFEYSSDPDDQSILYAISSRHSGRKGTFMESYGLYHEDMSTALLRKLAQHPEAA